MTEPPRPPRPRRDYAAEEEAGQQLTSAQILLRRGLTAEAEAAARTILAARPADAGAWELLGDIEASREAYAPACQAYQTALKAEPGRATAESKFAKLTLRQAERKRQKTLGVAYAASDTSLVRRTGDADGKRSALWNTLGSSLCPGLGQIVGGQITKGGILLAIFLLGLGLLAVLPHGTGRAYFTPAFWCVTAVITADWVYAVADAALAAPAKDASSPETDGWQV